MTNAEVSKDTLDFLGDYDPKDMKTASTIYPKEGVYVVRIDQVAKGKTYQNEYQCMFIDVTCLASIEGGGHSVGENYQIRLQKSQNYQKKSWHRDMANFIAQASGNKPEDVKPEDFEQVWGEAQVLTGMVVKAVQKNIITKAGKEITNCNFRHMTKQEVEASVSPSAVKMFMPDGILNE